MTRPVRHHITRGTDTGAWLYHHALDDTADPNPQREEDKATAVDQLLQLATPQQREVLDLYYISGLDTRAIAELLGISRDAAKARLTRGRNKLRRDATHIGDNLYP